MTPPCGDNLGVLDYHLKHYLRIIICLHGVYVDDKMAGSKYDGFKCRTREFN